MESLQWTFFSVPNGRLNWDLRAKRSPRWGKLRAKRSLKWPNFWSWVHKPADHLLICSELFCTSDQKWFKNLWERAVFICPGLYKLIFAWLRYYSYLTEGCQLYDMAGYQVSCNLINGSKTLHSEIKFISLCSEKINFWDISEIKKQTGHGRSATGRYRNGRAHRSSGSNIRFPSQSLTQKFVYVVSRT
jgi:hypothetical protein